MFNQLRKIISDFFGFTRTETNGLVIIFSLMIIFIILPYIFREMYSGKIPYSNVEEQTQLDSLIALLEKNESEKKPVSKDPVKESELFIFNPNDATVSEFELLGLDHKIALRINKYRQAGGVFRVKDDLLKIYGMPKSVYNSFYDFIDLPMIVPANIKKADKKLNIIPAINTPENIHAEPFIMDINLADTIDLKKVKGIGRVLSARIVKYKRILGGYVSVKQLHEVYGLNDETIRRMQEVCFISDNFNPKTIDINFADWYTMVKHPYIDKDVANAIIKYRSDIGPLRQKHDLKCIPLISDSLYLKLIPYLKL